MAAARKPEPVVHRIRSRGFRFALAVFLAAMSAAMTVAQACDLCGCYTPQLEARDNTIPFQSAESANSSSPPWFSGLYGAIAEQFTHFGTVQADGREVTNPSDQHLQSSITQLVAGYGINSRIALQVNVPFIYARLSDRKDLPSIGHGVRLGRYLFARQTHAFHKEIGGRRTVNFDDPKSPRMEMHEPDLTVSGLTGAITPEQRSKLLQIADMCPVHRTLKAEIDIQTRLV